MRKFVGDHLVPDGSKIHVHSSRYLRNTGRYIRWFFVQTLTRKRRRRTAWWRGGLRWAGWPDASCAEPQVPGSTATALGRTDACRRWFWKNYCIALYFSIDSATQSRRPDSRRTCSCSRTCWRWRVRSRKSPPCHSPKTRSCCWGLCGRCLWRAGSPFPENITTSQCRTSWGAVRAAASGTCAICDAIKTTLLMLCFSFCRCMDLYRA